MDYALKFLERKSQWANLAEIYIGSLKKKRKKGHEIKRQSIEVLEQLCGTSRFD